MDEDRIIGHSSQTDAKKVMIGWRHRLSKETRNSARSHADYNRAGRPFWVKSASGAESIDLVVRCISAIDFSHAPYDARME